MFTCSIAKAQRRLAISPSCRIQRHHYARRTFFSFLTEDKNIERKANDVSKIEAEEALIVNNALYRMSIQHAHPLGPWQAMLGAVEIHYARCLNEKKLSSVSEATPAPIIKPAPFRVLDLACGPLGEPGTTVAHALPLASVHCTDSCPIAVEAIPVIDAGDNGAITDNSIVVLQSAKEYQPLPTRKAPKNLTKKVLDLTDLSSYDTGSIDVILCCYGYGLSSDIDHALSEANRVLVPGGILVIATWERSAMLSIQRDALAYIRSGGRDAYAIQDEDEAYLPPRLPPVETIALAKEGELEGLLVSCGFDEPGAVISTLGTYPFDLGSKSNDQFAMGTILVRQEMKNLGAMSDGSAENPGGWGNMAEEAFWMSIWKYVDMEGKQMFLRDNVFKMTVSTKSASSSKISLRDL